MRSHLALGAGVGLYLGHLCSPTSVCLSSFEVTTLRSARHGTGPTAFTAEPAPAWLWLPRACLSDLVLRAYMQPCHTALTCVSSTPCQPCRLTRSPLPFLRGEGNLRASFF